MNAKGQPSHPARTADTTSPERSAAGGDGGEPLRDMSKTLHKGIRVLELLADNPRGLGLSELAVRLDLHRTVVHRLVRTLEHHGLVLRDPQRRILLAGGLVRLASRVEQELRTLAQPVLEDLAEQTQATAHLVILETTDAVRALLVIEPRGAAAHVAFSAGQTHPLAQGSAGLAILAGRPSQPGEPDAVTAAREAGIAITRAEVIPGTTGVSAPVPGSGDREMCVGVSLFEERPPAATCDAVRLAAQRLGALVG